MLLISAPCIQLLKKDNYVIQKFLVDILVYGVSELVEEIEYFLRIVQKPCVNSATCYFRVVGKVNELTEQQLGVVYCKYHAFCYQILNLLLFLDVHGQKHQISVIYYL